MWKNGVVPVCYDTSDGNNQNLLNRARYILDTYGWSAVSNLQFTGWGACGSSPADTSNGQLKVHFQNGTLGSTNFEGAGGTLFTQVTLISSTTDSDFDAHFQYEVLHEFGHAIGWDHEQQRPENYPNGPTAPEKYCTKNQNGQGEDQFGTGRTDYFDSESLMSYCAVGTTYPTQLSAGDVAGIQNTPGYGLKTGLPNRGANSSNNVASRGTGFLDTFFVHDDGSIWTAYWNSGVSGNWPTFQLPGAVAGTAPGTSAPIAAVSRANDNLDIFYVNKQGGINTNYWNPSGWGTATAPHMLTLPGTNGLAQPGEQIAAVSGSPGRIDVFYAGTNHNLYWSYWSGQCGGNSFTQCGWSNPIGVVTDGSIPSGAAVTAVARTPDRLDVFYIENDGLPHTSACYSFSSTGSCKDGEWANFLPNNNSACLANAGGHIAATARTANNIDLFYVNRSSAICTSSWSAAAGWQSKPISNNNTLASWSQIAAVTRAPNNLDIFFLGTNAQGTGELRTGFWASGMTSYGFGDMGGGFGGVLSPGGVLGAAARTSNNLDMFAPGILLFGGNFTSLTTSYWYTNGPGWTSYSVDSY